MENPTGLHAALRSAIDAPRAVTKSKLQLASYTEALSRAIAEAS